MFTADILTSWRFWLVAGALATILALAAVANSRAKEVRALTAEKTSLQHLVLALDDLVTEQNAAVAALKKASDAQARRAAQAAKAAERALGAANARAEALAHAEVPAACPAALEWLRDQVATAETARGAE